MELVIASGRFDPQKEVLSVRGDFNGWSDFNVMSPTLNNSSIYEYTTPSNYHLAEKILYKYAYNTSTGTAWEKDPNKEHIITQDDVDNNNAVVERTFNDVDFKTVTNNEASIKFTVNMNNTVDFNTGSAFSSIDNVVILGANAPLQWPGSGWPDSDSTKAIFLYDDGTNGDDMANDNESKNISDHFITLSFDMIKGTVRNTFGEMGDRELREYLLNVSIRSIL